MLAKGGPSHAINWYWSGWRLAMACCQTTPRHYLNQCRLIIIKAQWHPYEGNFIRYLRHQALKLAWKITLLEIKMIIHQIFKQNFYIMRAESVLEDYHSHTSPECSVSRYSSMISAQLSIGTCRRHILLGMIHPINQWLYIPIPWWRHQMETFSALLAICMGNSPVPGEFPAQRPVTRSFDVFSDLCLNKGLSKQSWGWWFETLSSTLWCHCNVVPNMLYVVSRRPCLFRLCDVIMLERGSDYPGTMTHGVTVLLTKVILEILPSKWQQCMIQNVPVQYIIETVSPEGIFCDTVQVPSGAGDMELN